MQDVLWELCLSFLDDSYIVTLSSTAFSQMSNLSIGRPDPELILCLLKWDFRGRTEGDQLLPLRIFVVWKCRDRLMGVIAEAFAILLLSKSSLAMDGSQEFLKSKMSVHHDPIT